MQPCSMQSGASWVTKRVPDSNATDARAENYGSVLRDCSKAITINPKSLKSFYRSALGLLALDRLDEALACCERCLSFDASNQAIRDVRDRVAKAKTEKDCRQREKEGRLLKERGEMQLLQAALKAPSSVMARDLLTDIKCRRDIYFGRRAPRGRQKPRIRHILIQTIRASRHWSFLCSFCIPNMRPRMLFLILWRIPPFPHTYRRCFRPRHLHLVGMRGGSIRQLRW